MRKRLDQTDVTKRVVKSLNDALGRGDVVDVIRKAGTSRDRTYAIFNGQVSPTLDELVLICRALNLDLIAAVRER